MRTHISHSEITELYNTNDYRYQSFELKPLGLWYSFNNHWSNFTKWAGWDAGEFIYELDIDFDNVLIINDVNDLDNFSKKYDDKKIHTKLLKSIDWNAVVGDYKGIEINNYHIIKHEMKTNYISKPWFLSFDISSGCIWDVSIIKNFKLVGRGTECIR